MKTLGKLKINSEKILKNEELVNLRGGYGGYYEGTCCACISKYDYETKGYIVGSTSASCDADCLTVYGVNGAWNPKC